MYEHPYLRSFPTRRSSDLVDAMDDLHVTGQQALEQAHAPRFERLGKQRVIGVIEYRRADFQLRSEEHTSELQSHHDLVCRLLLEKKNYEEANERFPLRSIA